MYVVHIRTNNAAFEEKGTELARILRSLADKIDGTDADSKIRLMDVNGNTVGAAGNDR